MTKQKFSTKEWRKVFKKYSNLGYPSEDEITSEEENTQRQMMLQGPDDVIDFDPIAPIGESPEVVTPAFPLDLSPNNAKVAEVEFERKPFVFSPVSSRKSLNNSVLSVRFEEKVEKYVYKS